MEKKRVLIADNNDVIRSLLEHAFRYIDLPCEVVTAEDSSTALKQVKQHQVDLAIVSYDLHGLDGLQVSERIRQQWPEVRLILMTDLGNNQPYKVRNWPAFDGFFTKPFSMTRFLEVVGYLLEPEKSPAIRFRTNGQNGWNQTESGVRHRPAVSSR